MAERIWALDVGTRLGWAIGEPGHLFESGAWVLKSRADHTSVAGSNLIYLLNQGWSIERPASLVKEAPLALQAFKNLGNAAHTVAVTLGLHAIIEAMCGRFSVPFANVHNARIRKHFIGTASRGDRAATKAAVVNRCRLLKYVPADCKDEDRCDAIATWDYACALTRAPAHDGLEFHFFGEEAVT